MPEPRASSTPEVTVSINNLTDVSVYTEALTQAGRRQVPPFVEILWDNYLHLSAEKVRETFEEVTDRVALHVMWTGFVHTDVARLERVLDCLAEHVRVLDPLYVSDHLLTIVDEGRYLSPPRDLRYDDELAITCERVQRYQERIGRPLLLENLASGGPSGRGQADFAIEVMRRTGAGLLFDVSNAIVAETNGGDPFSAWLPALSAGPVRAHVGGYRRDRPDGPLRDSHGDPVSARSIHAIEVLAKGGRLQSICLEREFDKSAAAIAEDLSRIEGAVSPEVITPPEVRADV